MTSFVLQGHISDPNVSRFGFLLHRNGTKLKGFDMLWHQRLLCEHKNKSQHDSKSINGPDKNSHTCSASLISRPNKTF